MKTRVLFLASVWMIFGLAASAAETEFPSISKEDLKKALEDKKVVLLDASGVKRYTKHHIPGALDFTTIKNDLAKSLPEDKGALIVVYCGNEESKAYKDAAEAAAKLGYTNVKYFAPGIRGWIKSKEKIEGAAEGKQCQTCHHQ